MKTILGISFEVIPYQEIHYYLVEINGNIQTVIHLGSKRHTGSLVTCFEVVIEEVRRFCVRGQPDEIWMIQRDGWIVECGGGADWCSDERDFALCPPFPSEELAQQAAEAVGIERINKAYATLSNIKGEVV